MQKSLEMKLRVANTEKEIITKQHPEALGELIRSIRDLSILIPAKDTNFLLMNRTFVVLIDSDEKTVYVSLKSRKALYQTLMEGLSTKRRLIYADDDTKDHIKNHIDELSRILEFSYDGFGIYRDKKLPLC